MPGTVNTFVESILGMGGRQKTSDGNQKTDWNANYRSELVTSGVARAAQRQDLKTEQSVADATQANPLAALARDNLVGRLVSGAPATLSEVKACESNKACTAGMTHGVRTKARMRMSGVFMLPRLELSRPNSRWRGRDTISQREAAACHRAPGFGSATAGVRRASSIASAGVWRSAC